MSEDPYKDLELRIAAQRYIEAAADGTDVHQQFTAAVFTTHDSLTFTQGVNESDLDFGTRCHVHLGEHYEKLRKLRKLAK